jgi:hypothetical protein
MGLPGASFDRDIPDLLFSTSSNSLLHLACYCILPRYPFIPILFDPIKRQYFFFISVFFSVCGMVSAVRRALFSTAI